MSNTDTYGPPPDQTNPPPPDASQVPPGAGDFPPNQGPGQGPDQGPFDPSQGSPQVPISFGNILPTALSELAPQEEERRWHERTRPPGQPPPNIPGPAQRGPNFHPNQQGQQPPRWPPTWRPNRRQNYVPLIGNRGPGRWGKPWAFPMLPSPWQIPFLYSMLGGQFGQFGSPGLAMLGMGLNRYTAAFMNGYQKGQALYTRQQKEQMDLHARMLDDAAQEQLDRYERVFREFGDPSDPNSIPPEKLEAFKAAIRDVANSMPGGADQHMLNALDNSGVQGVINQLNWLDGRHGDLKANRRSQEVNDRIRSTEDPIFHEGGTTGTGTGASAPHGVEVEGAGPKPGEGRSETPQGGNPLEAAPGEEAPAPGEEGAPSAAPGPRTEAEPSQQEAQAKPPQVQAQQDQDQQADQQAPDALGRRYPQVASADNYVPQPTDTAQAQVTGPGGAQPDQPIQSQVFDNAQQRHPRFGNLERGIVQNDAENSLFAGHYVGPSSKEAPEWNGLVRARWGEMAQQLNGILREPPPKTSVERSQYLSRIAAISPRLARAIQGYSDGTIAPPSAKSGSAAGGLSGWVTALAQRYDPTLSPSNIEVRKAVRKSFGSGQDGQKLTSVGTAYLHLGQYRQDLEEYRKLDWTTRQKIRRLGGMDLPDWARSNEYLSLTPEQRALVGRLNADENTSLNEVERAITGGKPTVTGRKEQSDQAGWRQDPESAIAAVDRLHSQLEARMHAQKLRYDAYLGPNTGTEGQLFDEYSKLGRVPEADVLGQPEAGNEESNRIVRESIKNGGKLPAFAPAAAPDPRAAPAPAAPAAPAAPRAAPAAPAQGALPPGVKQSRTIGGKTYYQLPDGSWDDQPPAQ